MVISLESDEAALRALARNDSDGWMDPETGAGSGGRAQNTGAAFWSADRALTTY
jgi:hypothetical protein